jgi:hypothetical protein
MSPNHYRSPMSLDLLARAPALDRVRPGRIALGVCFLALLLAFLTARPTVASAAPQEEDDEIETDGEDEDEDEEPMELDADRVSRPSGEVPAGASETPGGPNAAVGMERPKVETATTEKPVRPEEYPLAVALRPITLYSGVFEVGAGAGLFPSPAAFTTALRARYGITDQVEVGLRYALIGADENDTVSGKAMAVDVVVGITEFAAAQLSIPVLLDPFAMGFTLGVPLKFRFGDRFALFAGSDLFSYRIKDFVPSVLDPRINARRAEAIENNTIVSDGNLRVVGGAIYQLEPHMAVAVDIGVTTEFEELENPELPLGGTFTYTYEELLDLSARLGFDNIGEGSTFSLTAGLAVRL